MSELWSLLLLCVVVTYAWRGAGVLLSGRIATDSDAFRWITCVAYAMVAGLVMRIIVMPAGLLGTSLLAHRLAACGIGLAVYYLSRRNLFVAVVAGALAIAVLNYLRAPLG